MNSVFELTSPTTPSRASGLKAQSVLVPSTSTSGRTGAHPWVLPSASPSCSLVSAYEAIPHAEVRRPLARCRQGTPSLLRWVFLPCWARLDVHSRLRPSSSLAIVSCTSSFLATGFTGTRGTGAAGRDSLPRLRTTSGLPFPRHTPTVTFTKMSALFLGFFPVRVLQHVLWAALFLSGEVCRNAEVATRLVAEGTESCITTVEQDLHELASRL